MDIRKILKERDVNRIVDMLLKDNDDICITNIKLDSRVAAKYLLLNKLMIEKRLDIESLYSYSLKLLLISHDLIRDIITNVALGRRYLNYGKLPGGFEGTMIGDAPCIPHKLLKDKEFILLK